MTDEELLDKFKSHIEWEEDMDETMLKPYLKYATQYVKTATGKSSSMMIIMVAALLFEFRIPTDNMDKGLDALTPFLLSEVFAEDGSDEQA